MPLLLYRFLLLSRGGAYIHVDGAKRNVLSRRSRQRRKRNYPSSAHAHTLNKCCFFLFGLGAYLHGHPRPQARKVPRVEMPPPRRRTSSLSVALVPVSRIGRSPYSPPEGPRPPVLKVGKKTSRNVKPIPKCLFVFAGYQVCMLFAAIFIICRTKFISFYVFFCSFTNVIGVCSFTNVIGVWCSLIYVHISFGIRIHSNVFIVVSTTCLPRKTNSRSIRFSCTSCATKEHNPPEWCSSPNASWCRSESRRGCSGERLCTARSGRQGDRRIPWTSVCLFVLCIFSVELSHRGERHSELSVLGDGGRRGLHYCNKFRSLYICSFRVHTGPVVPAVSCAEPIAMASFCLLCPSAFLHHGSAHRRHTDRRTEHGLGEFGVNQHDDDAPTADSKFYEILELDVGHPVFPIIPSVGPLLSEETREIFSHQY